MKLKFNYRVMEEEGDASGGGGGGSETVAEWATGIQDEGLRSTLGKYGSQDEFFKTIGYEPPKTEEVKDWREGLDEDLKKTAERFNSPADAMRAILDLRKRESQARIPGKDASEEEIAKYQKAIGVPDKPEEYEWPELAEDQMTDEVKLSRQLWGERFKQLNVPKDAAKAIAEMVNEDMAAYEEMVSKQDQEFAKESETVLRKEWGADFEKNQTLANRALEGIANQAGVDVEVLRSMEMKNGRYLLDDASMLRMFSVIGREMDEGSLGPALTETESEALKDQIDNIRTQINEAQAKGDSKKANALYQKEQALVAKLSGSKPVVGASGRSV